MQRERKGEEDKEDAKGRKRRIGQGRCEEREKEKKRKP